MTGQPDPSPFDTTLTSRYECKYLIDRRTAQAVRRQLALHMHLDPYSARQADHRYRVLSLYLDSPTLRLYQDTAQGILNRYKLRLRYYAESLDGPVFFEVKKRANVIVRKSRELATGGAANDFLVHGRVNVSGHGNDMHEFLECCRANDARPSLRIRYWREAWESRGVDPVRVTFDTSVEHCIPSDAGLVETCPEWRGTAFDDEVVLEVKFTDHCPRWLRELLCRFELDKVSVAKYAESVDSVRARGEGHALEAHMRRTPSGVRWVG